MIRRSASRTILVRSHFNLQLLLDPGQRQCSSFCYFITVCKNVVPSFLTVYSIPGSAMDLASLRTGSDPLWLCAASRVNRLALDASTEYVNYPSLTFNCLMVRTR